VAGRTPLPGGGTAGSARGSPSFPCRAESWAAVSVTPLTSSAPVSPRNCGDAASSRSARATGAGSAQAGAGSRSSTFVGLLLATGKWAATSALPAAESEPRGAPGAAPKPAGVYHSATAARPPKAIRPKARVAAGRVTMRPAVRPHQPIRWVPGLVLDGQNAA